LVLLSLQRVVAIAIATATVLALSGCYARMSKAVDGSGVAKTESREPGAFERVRLDGSADVIVKVRDGAVVADEVEPAAAAAPLPAAAVTVSGDDNILPLIETEVRGGELVISSRASYRAKTPVKVTVNTLKLDKLQLNGSGRAAITGARGGRLEVSVRGSGDVRIERLEVDRLDVDIAGSGNVNGDGSADHVHVSIAGSGDVRLGDVAAQSAEVKISGSGDATLNAAATLNARIAGSGDVRYRGAPKVESSVAGSGKVKPAE
jgi:hypothetical protein